MRFLKKLIIGISIIFVTNCGLHLQGLYDMPKWFNNVAIVNQNVQHDLRPLIAEELRAYKIHLCHKESNADYLLILEEDKQSENITAVSSSTTPRQYQMNYIVRYKVQRTKNGKDVVPSSKAHVTRLFTINSNRILGSDYEGDLLRKEMYKDAVAQIIDHIENVRYAN